MQVLASCLQLAVARGRDTFVITLLKSHRSCSLAGITIAPLRRKCGWARNKQGGGMDPQWL